MIPMRGPRWYCREIGARLLLLSGFAFVSSPLVAGVPADFAQDIRPILSDKCFACHGPDANKRSGGFRLVVKSSAFGEADSGASPIVPGSLSESALIARI